MGGVIMSATPSNRIPFDRSTGAESRQSPQPHWATAILQQRCPRCREGKLFKGILAMHDACPVCGLVFEREPGYFLGAMYISYGLAIVILVPLFFVLQWLLPDWSDILVAALAAVPYLALSPLVFRYSRVLWMHFDTWGAPSQMSDPQSWSRWQRSDRGETLP